MPKSKKTSGKFIILIAGVFFLLATISFVIAQTCNYQTDNKFRWPYPPEPVVGYLQSYENCFGQKVVRVSGTPGTSIPNLTRGVWGTMVKPRYQTESVWNADETIMRLMNKGGKPSEIFLDGKTYKPLLYKPGIPGIMVWHPIYSKIRVFASGNKLGFQDVTTGKIEIKKVFEGYDGLTIDSKGQLSEDGSTVVLQCFGGGPGISSSEPFFFAYNMVTDKKYPDIRKSKVRWLWNLGAGGRLTITPSGEYIFFTNMFTPGHTHAEDKVLDLEGNTVQFWGAPQYEAPGHGDLGFDAEGNEVLFGYCKRHPDRNIQGHFITRNIKTGAINVRSGKVSGSTSSFRNFKLRNWGFTQVVDANSNPSEYGYRNELLMVKLSGPLEVRRLGPMYFYPTKSYSNNRLVPSPSGTRLAFMSNGFNASNPIVTYVIETCDYRKTRSFSDTSPPNRLSGFPASSLPIGQLNQLGLLPPRCRTAAATQLPPDPPMIR